jgi:NAD(P)H dehydrogenase (quinone)
MIIITGATGQLGHGIVKCLLTRLTTAQVGVSVRDPSKATALEALGVRVRQGDFGNPASLAHAFEGASQVLIVSSNARASGGDPLAQHRVAIDAGRTGGAK